LQGSTVRLWYVPAPQAAALGDEMAFLVNEFNHVNPWGIHLDGLAFPDASALAQAVKQASTLGGLPDVLLGHTYELVSWDADGRLLADLTPYLADPQWGLSADEQADFYSVFWNHEVVNGKRLALPFQRNAVALFYNQGWAQALGFAAPPQTPAELERQACAAAQANRLDDDPANDGRGGLFLSSETVMLTSWIHAFGGEITQPDGSGYRFDTPQAEKALTFLRRLQDKSCAWLASEISPADGFASRQALFRLGSSSELDAQIGAMKLAANRDAWTVIPFPSADSQPVMSVYGVSLAVVKSTAQTQLAAWLVARWLAEPANQARWIWSYGGFPTRASTQRQIGDYITARPQWQAMLELWLYAREEPLLPSWRVARWSVQDAALRLFAPNFSLADIPPLLDNLDRVTSEIHVQIR